MSGNDHVLTCMCPPDGFKLLNQIYMEVAPMDESYGGVSYTSNYNKPKKYLVPVIFDKYEKEEDSPTEEVTDLSELGCQLWSILAD